VVLIVLKKIERLVPNFSVDINQWSINDPESISTGIVIDCAIGLPLKNGSYAHSGAKPKFSRSAQEFGIMTTEGQPAVAYYVESQNAPQRN
jgi:hypothetical protein